MDRGNGGNFSAEQFLVDLSDMEEDDGGSAPGADRPAQEPVEPAPSPATTASEHQSFESHAFARPESDDRPPLPPAPATPVERIAPRALPPTELLRLPVAD